MPAAIRASARLTSGPVRAMRTSRFHAAAPETGGSTCDSSKTVTPLSGKRITALGIIPARRATSMCPTSWAATQARTMPTSARSRDPLAEPCTLYSVQKTNKGRSRKVRWMRTSTPNSRPTWMEKLRMSLATTVILHGRIYWPRYSKVQRHARDRRQISRPCSAVLERGRYPADVGPVAGDAVQCAHGGESGGTGGHGLAGSVCRHWSGGNRGPEPGSQAGVLRRYRAAGGGIDRAEP